MALKGGPSNQGLSALSRTRNRVLQKGSTHFRCISAGCVPRIMDVFGESGVAFFFSFSVLCVPLPHSETGYSF